MAHDAVIFDLDGTLLDTLADLAASMNAALAEQGLPTHPLNAFRYFVGDGVVMFARRALGEQHAADPDIVELTLALQRGHYAGCWADRTRAYDGVDELLDGLAARGVAMAVLSNKPHDFTVKCVESLLPRERFACVEGVRDGRPCKPDPAGALEIAERLKVAPADALYVGDTNTDMQTAVAAGMTPVGALWGFRDAEELTQSGAVYLADHPTDVLTLG